MRVLCAGLGVIGAEIAHTVDAHPEAELVGCVDVSPALAGTNLGGLPVRPDLGEAVAELRPDVVVLATTSRLDELVPQAAAALRHGAHVVSTCEELSYPWGRPGAQVLHETALRHGRGVLGTGVNPGFVMDCLAAVLTLPCLDVRAVEVDRTVDLRRRRPALRRKAGVGMTVAAFEDAASRDAIGHVGLDCSAQLVAVAVGWSRPPRPPVELEPLADDRGEVIGFRQRVAFEDPRLPRVELRLEMSMRPVGPERDLLKVDGRPPLEAELVGGVYGDSATAAMVVNSLRELVLAPPGLHTVLDLPFPSAWKPALEGAA